jgi:hypothetical protein
MTLWRAIRMGTLPGGRRVREGETFEAQELGGRAPGTWMELADGVDPLPDPPQSADEEIAIALNEAPLAEAESESAPKAESKTRKRK